jgi:hypothetical protein
MPVKAARGPSPYQSRLFIGFYQYPVTKPGSLSDAGRRDLHSYSAVRLDYQIMEVGQNKQLKQPVKSNQH